MRRRVLSGAVLLWAATSSAAPLSGGPGQDPSEPSPLTFEVASIKADTTDTPTTSRFPLGPGDAYVRGSLFSATNVPLIDYIRFAFGRSQGEMLNAPSWVYSERFDIQGRAKGEATKTDMRFLVRALLVDRFKLTWHTEPRVGAVLALTVATPGKLGPQIALHRQGEPCGQDPKFADIPCGSAGLVAASRPDLARIGGRAEPIARLAAFLSNNGFVGVDREVIDRTGLDGQFDFTVEFSMPAASAETQPTVDVSGPSLVTALREQLGLKLEATRAPINVLVVDRIERPSSD
jgi:uncharacterized protein (TIGR03435 family)